MPARPSGKKSPYTPAQLAFLRERLELARDWRALAILNTGIDTMLRASDLVRLTVGDVLGRSEIVVVQKKTGTPVHCSLLPHTVQSVAKYVEIYGLKASDRLFDMCERSLVNMCKRWAVVVGENPAEYAAHSLRRSKAVALAENCSAAELDRIRELLGHRYLTSTQEYLGTTRRKALDFARSHTI